MKTQIKVTEVDGVSWYEAQYWASTKSGGQWVSLVIGDQVQTTDINKAKQAIDEHRKINAGRKVYTINYP